MYTDFVSQFFDETSDIKEVRFCTDLQNRFQYANQHFCEIIKFYSGKEFTPETLVGLTVSDALPAKITGILKKLDEDVLQKQCKLTFYSTFEFKKHTMSIAITVRPYFHEDRLLGTLTQAQYLNLYMIDGEPVVLSPRELDVLVHHTFGITYKVTASNLNISVGTIVTYVDRIRKKLKVQNQKQLLLLLNRHAIDQHILKYLCSILDKSNPRLLSDTFNDISF